jgi:nucleoside-diphosphate-sugar epimerase
MGCDASRTTAVPHKKVETSKKTVFLLGGTGRTGLNFAKAILDKGHSITACVRREPKVPGTLATSGGVIGTGSGAELGGAGASAKTSEAHLAVIGPHQNLKIVVVPD